MKTPHSYLSASCGVLRVENMKGIQLAHAYDILHNIGEVFIKPSVDTYSGVGCSVANFKNGIDTISGKAVPELLKELGDSFVVQERICCHSSIAGLYPHSVNTFRVITYRYKDRVWHVPTVLRIGQGGNYLDNAHAGGMFVAIMTMAHFTNGHLLN